MRLADGQVQASTTALGDAFIRGFHHAHEAAAVFSDPVAARLLTTGEWSSLTDSVLRSVARTHPDLLADRTAAVTYWLYHRSVAAPHVLLRARYAEDLLSDFCAGGQGQYVLLGAGLDSLALRRPRWADGLAVVEIDHPSTQRSKADRVARLDPAPGQDARRVPADFGAGELGPVLYQRSGLDPAARTFVSWCGVTYYLDPAQIDAVLTTLQKFFTGELTVALDYWDAAHMAPERQAPEVASMFASVRRNGEPFVSGFTPPELAGRLVRTGFDVVEDVATAEVAARCAAAGSVELHAHPLGRLLHARRSP